MASKTNGNGISRRSALKHIGAASALTVTPACSSDDDATDDRDGLPEYEYDGPPGPKTLFKHGVASGDPLPDAVILWTRVSPMDDGGVEVWWEIAADQEFRRRVAVGTFDTSDERDFTVKQDVDGLKPATTYYYRFKALGRTSPIGRTRTAPAATAKRLRFAVVSCSSYARGYFHAYREVAELADLDAVLHLGDYIYEYDGMGDPELETSDVRTHAPLNEIVTLQDYRTRYAQYRSDPNLQEVHRQHPFIVVWDDHETANNSWKNGAGNHDPATEGEWKDRKAAGIQAHAEWMPFREVDRGRIYRKLSYGDLADIVLLDTRLWARDEPIDELIGEIPVEEPGRTLLGDDQATWLEDQLRTSKAKWKIVGQQVMVAQLKAAGKPNSEGGGTIINYDQWHAYPASRERFMDLLSESDVQNVVVLTGDIHSSWANDLTVDPNNPDFYDAATGKGSVAVEFVTPGVTSPGFPPALAGIVDSAITGADPHIKYFEVTKFGYMILDVDEDRAQAAWRHFDDVRTEEPQTSEAAKVFATYAGKPFVVEESKAASPSENPPELAGN